MRWPWQKKLDIIECALIDNQNELVRLLTHISKGIAKMDQQQTDLDTGLAQVVTNLDSLSKNLASIGTALTKFIADYKANNGVDLTGELSTVTGLVSKTSDAAAALASDVSAINEADPGTLASA